MRYRHELVADIMADSDHELEMPRLLASGKPECCPTPSCIGDLVRCFYTVASKMIAQSSIYVC